MFRGILQLLQGVSHNEVVLVDFYLPEWLALGLCTCIHITLTVDLTSLSHHLGVSPASAYLYFLARLSVVPALSQDIRSEVLPRLGRFNLLRNQVTLSFHEKVWVGSYMLDRILVQ